jgi:hypothetical protein
MAANGLLKTSELTDVGGGKLLRADAAAAWLALVVACFVATGVRLTLTEGYRNLARQTALYLGWIGGHAGFNVASIPGRSNHGLGIAVDMGNYAAAWDWLLANAHLYGWSWAQGKASGERWHWVFVGGATVAPASGNTVQIPLDTPNPRGDTLFYIQCNPYPDGTKQGATGPFAGATYRRDERTGAWRACTNIETEAIIPDLIKKGLAEVYPFNPADLELLFAVDGLLEQTPFPLSPPTWGGGKKLGGLGAPTGRIIFPGSETSPRAEGLPARGKWHAV